MFRGMHQDQGSPPKSSDTPVARRPPFGRVVGRLLRALRAREEVKDQELLPILKSSQSRTAGLPLSFLQLPCAFLPQR